MDRRRVRCYGKCTNYVAAFDGCGLCRASIARDALQRNCYKEQDGESVKEWLWSGSRIVAEYDYADNTTSVFVYAGATAPAYMTRGGVTYRIITDNQGSVRLVVDVETGEVAQRLDYDSFGRVLRDTNPGFQPFGFQGGLYDPDTGLVEFGCRWYDAETERWISKDPIGLSGGMNMYEFCRSNPFSYADPSGLTIVWDLESFPGSRPIDMIPDPAITTHMRFIKDGQYGLVQLHRTSAKELDGAMRDVAERLHGYAKEEGGRTFFKDLWHEAIFDTSFFAGPGEQHEYYLIEGHDGLWADNEVNYIGIGMYEAWLNHSMEWAETITALWKLQYFSPPSVGTYYWLKYGYNQFRPYYGEK